MVAHVDPVATRRHCDAARRSAVQALAMIRIAACVRVFPTAPFGGYGSHHLPEGLTPDRRGIVSTSDGRTGRVTTTNGDGARRSPESGGDRIRRAAYELFSR